MKCCIDYYKNVLEIIGNLFYTKDYTNTLYINYKLYLDCFDDNTSVNFLMSF